MGLLGKYLREAVDTMERDHIRLKILGDPEILPKNLRDLIDETADISTHYSGFQANVCLNYGGRDEIVRAAMRFAEDYKAGRATTLTEESFSNYMFSAGIPDPDLITRPAGRCGFQTSSCGRARIRSSSSPTCSGRTSPART